MITRQGWMLVVAFALQTSTVHAAAIFSNFDNFLHDNGYVLRVNPLVSRLVASPFDVTAPIGSDFFRVDSATVVLTTQAIGHGPASPIPTPAGTNQIRASVYGSVDDGLPSGPITSSIFDIDTIANQEVTVGFSGGTILPVGQRYWLVLEELSGDKDRRVLWNQTGEDGFLGIADKGGSNPWTATGAVSPTLAINGAFSTQLAIAQELILRTIYKDDAPVLQTNVGLSITNGVVNVELNVHLHGAEGFEVPNILRLLFQQGIQETWGRQGVLTDKDHLSTYPIRFRLNFVDESDPNAVVVNVFNRKPVGMERFDALNWYIDRDSDLLKKTVAHEYGHLMGLYDEYSPSVGDPVLHPINPITDSTGIMGDLLGMPELRHYEFIESWARSKTNVDIVLGRAPGFETGVTGLLPHSPIGGTSVPVPPALALLAIGAGMIATRKSGVGSRLPRL